MPITETLKKLIKTITGIDAEGETIEELIRDLNENYPEGGNKNAEFVVTFTAEVDQEGHVTSLSADKRVTEILAAKSAGKKVIAKVDAGIYTMEFILSAYGPGLTGKGLVGFASAIPDAGDSRTAVSSVLGTAGAIEGAEDSWYIYD